MDDIVKQALAKWPNVPACTDWLGLDARGQWWMRDDACQQRGSFQSGCAEGDLARKGSLLQHDKLIAFIQRNYGVDAQGFAWFQNGPQRVFVELESCPFVLRVQNGGQRIYSAMGHSGHEQGWQDLGDFAASYTDEAGHLYLPFANRGQTQLGRVHSQDMIDALHAIESGRLPAPTEAAFSALETQFHFTRSPHAAGAARLPESTNT